MTSPDAPHSALSASVYPTECEADCKPLAPSFDEHFAADRVKEGDDSSLTSSFGEMRVGDKLAAGLYVVATPIGNLGDITARARQTLASADIVACEDTRVTGSLLHHLGIAAKLLPYHEHNAERARPQILERLRAGQAVALVSDAGTPLISDPGYKLVREVRDLGMAVVPVPGASALLSALMVAGLPTDRFLFVGFLPNKDKARLESLQELKTVPATLIFYESTRRIPETLAAMTQVFGDHREAAVCRELTKLYEDVRRAPLAELLAHYQQAGAPRGEAVIVVAPPANDQKPADGEDLDSLLRMAMRSQSVRDAAATVAAASGLKKRDVYARALQLAAEENNTEAE